METGPLDAGAAVAPPTWTTRRIVKRAVLLLLTALSLYLLFPKILAALIVPAEAASFFSIWILQRVALRTRRWFPIAASQLAGTSFGRVVPGGSATGTALQVGMLRRAGIGGMRTAAALAAAQMLMIATLLALPLLSIPAIVGGAPVARNLAVAAYLGAVALVVMICAGGVAFATDGPLRHVSRALEWSLNRTVRRRRPIHDLPATILAERDFIKRTIGERWFRALAAATGSPAFDFLALLCALRAVGARPLPSVVLLAYVAASFLGAIPLTPGGLGFVEAGLVGLLTVADVSAGDAVVSTLAYRLAAFWLPIPIGGAAYLMYRRRYG
jgi:uncharacterized protein (TIRG00374 family)